MLGKKPGSAKVKVEKFIILESGRTSTFFVVKLFEPKSLKNTPLFWHFLQRDLYEKVGSKIECFKIWDFTTQYYVKFVNNFW